MEDLIVVVDRYKSIDAWCENPILKEESFKQTNGCNGTSKRTG